MTGVGSTNEDHVADGAGCPFMASAVEKKTTDAGKRCNTTGKAGLRFFRREGWDSASSGLAVARDGRSLRGRLTTEAIFWFRCE